MQYYEGTRLGVYFEIVSGQEFDDDLAKRRVEEDRCRGKNK